MNLYEFIYVDLLYSAMLCLDRALNFGCEFETKAKARS